MSEFLNAARAEEASASAALAVAEDIERWARCKADYERRKVLALRQFIHVYAQFESLPDMQPAQTEADHPSGDIGDHAAGVPLAPAAAIHESDGGAFAAVKVSDRLADAVGVEPSPSGATQAKGANSDGSSEQHVGPADGEQHHAAPVSGAERRGEGVDAGDQGHGAAASRPDQEPRRVSRVVDRGDEDRGSGHVGGEAHHGLTPIREDSRERQTAGDTPASKPEASTQEPPVEELGATAANGRHEVAPAVIAQIPNDSGPQSDISAGLVITSEPAAKPLVKDRVKALHAEHPELTYAEAAERLGLSKGSLAGHCSILGIKFRALTKAAPAAVPKDDGAESRRRKYGAPEPQVEPEPESIVAPAVIKFGSPDAKWFRLRRQDGMWLHMSGSGFTAHKPDSWIGRIGQLRAARTRFPDAKGLVIVGETAVAR